MLRQVRSIAVQHACLDKQASVIQSPDDSIHRAPAQCKAEGVTRSPMHADNILCACKDATAVSVAMKTKVSAHLTFIHADLYVSSLRAVQELKQHLLSKSCTICYVAVGCGRDAEQPKHVSNHTQAWALTKQQLHADACHTCRSAAARIY